LVCDTRTSINLQCLDQGTILELIKIYTRRLALNTQLKVLEDMTLVKVLKINLVLDITQLELIQLKRKPLLIQWAERRDQVSMLMTVLDQVHIMEI